MKFSGKFETISVIDFCICFTYNSNTNYVFGLLVIAMSVTIIDTYTVLISVALTHHILQTHYFIKMKLIHFTAFGSPLKYIQ